MRVRQGNPYHTKMTKNNILNKELKFFPTNHSVMAGEEVKLGFTVEGVEVEVRLTEEELEDMLSFLKKCKENK